MPALKMQAVVYRMDHFANIPKGVKENVQWNYQTYFRNQNEAQYGPV